MSKKTPHPLSAFDSLRKQVSTNSGEQLETLDLTNSGGAVNLEDLGKVLSKFGIFIYGSLTEENVFFFTNHMLDDDRLQLLSRSHDGSE